MDCQAWLHDKDWRVTKRAGQPVPRAPGLPLPCGTCPKSTDGKPNPGAELTGRNARAYEYYLSVRAGCGAADDPIVRANCALIQSVVERVERARSDVRNLLGLITGGK